MEVEEMQAQGYKYQRISNGNGRIGSSKLGGQYPDEEDDGKPKRGRASASASAGGFSISGGLCGWPSSRIVRVSRASGGKDRHSKVLTSKGLRDRRVRLSVNTAIQFYDLQDRLGFEQPSKAVEWLLKAAESSIAKLPSINPPFPEIDQQISDEKRSSTGTEPGLEETNGDQSFEHEKHQQQHMAMSKSACSSTSETSKGSGLSLSRSENRVKARERAKLKVAEKEKEKENDSSRIVHFHHQNVSPIPQSSSFTELLTGGIVGSSNPNGTAESSFFPKSPSPMFDFANGILGQSSTRGTPTFLGQLHHHHHHQPPITSIAPPIFSISGDNHHPEMQQFSFVPDNLIQSGGTHGNNGNGDYNLSFSISPSTSSGIAGFNRGTLQSNSSPPPSLFPHNHHIQRFSPLDGPPQTFYIGTAATPPPNAVVLPVENQHHFMPAGFDARLQLFYGDGHVGRHSDQKGKGKN